MQRLRLATLILLLVWLGVGCALPEKPAPVVPKSDPAAMPRWLFPPPLSEAALAREVGPEVDAILYTARSKEEILAALAPYAALMDTRDDLLRKRGLAANECLGSGPGVLHCTGLYSGLQLVFDPEGKLRVIRRSKAVKDGVAYPEMSLSANGFESRGYMRRYPD